MEKELNEYDFIVSKTDTRGNITYANESFIKIIYAKESDILNKPHNIVRHPDMPKAVFKYLWQQLKARKEVYAFVKNKTFDNGYYWVFANISVSYDLNGNIIGYYSVRRKIGKRAKELIISLYKKMIEVEKSKGVDESWKIIEEILHKENKTYNEFIISIQDLKWVFLIKTMKKH